MARTTRTVPAGRTPRKRETAGERKARAAAVIAVLEHAYPEAECALRHRSAYELLVATILSAQCTDARVNLVTPELFRRWPDPASLARAPLAEVEEVVRTTGFFRNKARNVTGAAKRIVAEHGGEVPDRMAELTALPGVARKTANVVLGTWFGKNEGVVVDTHVARVSGRLGFTGETDPKKIEQDLTELVPRAAWTDFSHRVILHGRRICVARKPRCAVCPVRELCPSRQDGPLEATLARTRRGDAPAAAAAPRKRAARGSRA